MVLSPWVKARFETARTESVIARARRARGNLVSLWYPGYMNSRKMTFSLDQETADRIDQIAGPGTGAGPGDRGVRAHLGGDAVDAECRGFP